ncbi:linear amide C-N hydrolase [Fictibacillus fluitans]|uniref:Linear amide C-N hydrolase n=1 Tax=Fictibacillus fluitans TaxID=3058422 RepID=A0ABT8I2I9_9BACL|nr:linear amide C-N hydrolase [Fictibacillus sp. NE201]MDN4527244.1 linear amide C-N hydrolase [Fictibacillus sp. NE201]
MCTNIVIPRKFKNDPLVSARTMDWAIELPTAITFFPRGQSFPEFKLSEEEIHWKNSLAFIGAVHPEKRTIYDGLNEAGLSACGLSLFCSEYPERKSSSHILNTYNVVSYVLGNFKTIQEAKTALSKLTIINPFNDPLLAQHFIISDISGNHLIVEFVNGKMKTYTTKLGVLTNDPPYDWHLLNLKLYENLSLEDTVKLCGVGLGGSGQLGIPGDPTPQSRFVRAAFLQRTAFQPKDTQQSIGVARQIIQTLSVPAGTAYGENSDFYDWTLWTVIRDHTNLTYYFYTDFNSKLCGVRLKKFDVNSKSQQQINIVQPDWYKDVSKRMKSE